MNGLKNFGLVVAGMLVAFLGSGVAMMVSAHNGGDPNLIHACVSRNGSISVVGATEECGSGKTALDWPAAPAVPGYVIVKSGPRSFTCGAVAPSTCGFSVTAICPTGTEVLGGGVGDLSGAGRLTGWIPFFNVSTNESGYVVNVAAVGPQESTVVSAYAVCADVVP